MYLWRSNTHPTEQNKAIFLHALQYNIGQFHEACHPLLKVFFYLVDSMRCNSSPRRQGAGSWCYTWVRSGGRRSWSTLWGQDHLIHIWYHAGQYITLLLPGASWFQEIGWSSYLPACWPLPASMFVFGGDYKGQQWQSPVPVSAEQAWQ